MAEPFDSAIYLEDASNVIQTAYMSEFTEEYPKRFGSFTNKMIKPYKEIAATDGIVMQYELGPADSVRTDTSPLGAFPSPQVLQAGQLRLRFNRNNAATNDFTNVKASVQFDLYTIENKGEGVIVDIAQRVYNSINDDYNEKMAILRQVHRSGQIALVNGTAKKNDSWYLSGASASATNTAGLRCAIDTGSISAFRNNVRVDFINPSTGAVRAGNVRVTSTNVTDLSVGVEFVTSGPTGTISTGDLSTVADNDIIVFSGTYNKGYYGFGAWFGRPTSSDSFIGGVNRSTSSYHWMLPISTREGSSAAKITRSMFDELMVAMGFISEDPQNGLACVADPTIVNTIRQELGEQSFIQIPEGDSRLERFANFGSVGLNYQHATCGVIKIAADPLMVPNTVRFISSDTWKAVFVNHKGLRPVMEAGKHWYRMNESTPNTGKSLIYKADWFGDQVDFCMAPWKNGQMLNVTA